MVFLDDHAQSIGKLGFAGLRMGAGGEQICDGKRAQRGAFSTVDQHE
jgi:hypothetical protein